MRILAGIFGFLLLLPGVCFLGFGILFLASDIQMFTFWALWMVIGALITALAIYLLVRAFR